MMHAIVAGGGRVGEQVARALVARGASATVVEVDPARAAALGGRGLAVVAGNACAAVVLEAAGALRAEALVACTGSDQENLMVCLLARRHLAIPRVVARLNDDVNRWLFEPSWGVDATVSTAMELVALVEETTEPPEVATVSELSALGKVLLEARLTPESAMVDRPVAELATELGAAGTVAAVVRRERTLAPEAGMALRAGDRVLVLADPGAREQVGKVLAARAPRPDGRIKPG